MSGTSSAATDLGGERARLLNPGPLDEDWFPARWGPAALAISFALLAGWSWGKWTDVQIDFGNELYVAWQLSSGKALYRDIAYRNGPLSSYLNALWFALFGVSIRTLVLCNLAILVAICAMTYRLFRESCGRFTATVVGLVQLAVFGFSQYVVVGNYNYVTPYQHSQTHGLALSLAMILALGEALRRHSPRWSALGGGLLGLVLLTKAELAVAAAAAAGTGGLLILAGEGFDWRSWARHAAAFAAAASAPLAGFFFFLSMQMPAELALGGVLGNWSYLGAGLLSDPFYRRGSGLDDVPGQLWLALRMFAGFAAFGLIALGADAWLAAHRRRVWWSTGLVLFLVAWWVGAPDTVPWMQLPRALPLTTLSVGAAIAALLVCSRQRHEALVRWAPLALWSVYALALLGKIILRARFHHYGFALGMPAGLLLVASLVYGLPALLPKDRGHGLLARSLSVAAVGAGMIFFLIRSNEFYARKDFQVGAGADAILTDAPRYNPRGRVFRRALETLEGLMPPGATLLVMPEGIGLNYWLRRVNPTRFTLFLPAELRAFGGDERMLGEIRAHPPDFIALVHRVHREFGVGPFGVDPRNGQRLKQWVDAHYERVERIGAEPFGRRGFGIDLMRRRADAGESSGVAAGSRAGAGASLR